MPYFPDGSPADEHFTDDEIALMNTRYDQRVEDVEPVNPDEGQTEEDYKAEITAIIDEIRSDMESADDEEKAFLHYLHNVENDDTAWFDDFTSRAGSFWGRGTLISQGRSAEYAVVPEADIDEVFKSYGENYVDECVLPGANETLQRYFDYDKFIEDLKTDGYGIMSSYDGNYEEVTFDDVTYYIFRLN